MKALCVFTCVTSIALLSGCVGPSADERSVVRMNMPRINVHTYMTPESLRDAIRADGCTVEEPSGLDKGVRRLLIVEGTGVVHWPSATIKVEHDQIVINGTRVESRAEGYRNVTVAKDGRVYPDRSIPFERPLYKLW